MLAVPMLSVLVLGSAPDDSFWHFGDGLREGDVFVYDICDDRFSDSYTAEFGRCYEVSLDVQKTMTLNNGTYHLLRAVTTDYTGTVDRLFVLDSQRYEIRHIFWDDADYASSLQNTVFWQEGWGKKVPTRQDTSSSVSLMLESKNADSVMVPSDRTIASNGAIQHTLLHDSFGMQSHFVINDVIPLPVSADIFSFGPTKHATKNLFSFELTNHTAPSLAVSAEGDTSYPEIRNKHYEVDWPQ